MEMIQEYFALKKAIAEEDYTYASELFDIKLRLWVLTGVFDFGLCQRKLTEAASCYRKLGIIPKYSRL